MNIVTKMITYTESCSKSLIGYKMKSIHTCKHTHIYIHTHAYTYTHALMHSQ